MYHSSMCLNIETFDSAMTIWLLLDIHAMWLFDTMWFRQVLCRAGDSAGLRCGQLYSTHHCRHSCVGVVVAPQSIVSSTGQVCCVVITASCRGLCREHDHSRCALFQNIQGASQCPVIRALHTACTPQHSMSNKLVNQQVLQMAAAVPPVMVHGLLERKGETAQAKSPQKVAHLSRSQHVLVKIGMCQICCNNCT